MNEKKRNQNDLVGQCIVPCTRKYGEQKANEGVERGGWRGQEES